MKITDTGFRRDLLSAESETLFPSSLLCNFEKHKVNQHHDILVVWNDKNLQYWSCRESFSQNEVILLKKLITPEDWFLLFSGFTEPEAAMQLMKPMK